MRTQQAERSRSGLCASLAETQNTISHLCAGFTPDASRAAVRHENEQIQIHISFIKESMTEASPREGSDKFSNDEMFPIFCVPWK